MTEESGGSRTTFEAGGGLVAATPESTAAVGAWTGPSTERARRSLPGRLAPVAVLLLGLLYVGVALGRLDDIYAEDPGVLRSWQVVPAPVAVARQARFLLGSAWDRAEGRQSAEACQLDPLVPGCSGDIDRRRKETEAGKPALTAFAESLASGGSGVSTDLMPAAWQDHPDRLAVVAVARFDRPAAARQALAASTVPGNAPPSGRAIAHTTWLAGERVLVAVVASATDQASADALLAESRRQAAAYVELVRVVSFEILAIGPLLLLFLGWVSARYLVLLALVVVFAAVGLVFIAILIPVLVVFLLMALIQRLRSRNAPAPAVVVAPPVEGPTVEHRTVEAPSAWLPGDQVRVASLEVIVLIGFGVAAFTTTLFPWGLAWGSLVLATVGTAPAWSRRLRNRTLVRQALCALVPAAVVAMLWGVNPSGPLGLTLLLVLIALGLAVLVSRWRGLTAGTELSYTKWYEDVDPRSTLFLVGAALLMIGAGSLFLASNGNPDLRAQIGEKAFAVVGLAIALSASSNIRGTRDAARRDKARERKAPPVLYLRSFGDDGLHVRSPRMQRVGLERLSWRRNELFEDVIAQALSRIGPVVAIAKPGTGQRDLGPARDSIVTTDWLGAVKTYMGEAVLVAVVIGSSEGLVRELETLGELGLLDRLCVFIPPVDEEEANRRLAVLGRQRGYSNTWGALKDVKKQRIVAMTSIGGQRCVVTAPKRTALAYRNCAEGISAVPPIEAERTTRGADEGAMTPTRPQPA